MSAANTELSMKIKLLENELRKVKAKLSQCIKKAEAATRQEIAYRKALAQVCLFVPLSFLGNPAFFVSLRSIIPRDFLVSPYLLPLGEVRQCKCNFYFYDNLFLYFS